MEAQIGELCSTIKDTVNPQNHLNEEFRHYSIPAFDAGQTPELVKGAEIQSNKLRINRPCLLFSRLNPRIKRVWDLTSEELDSHSIGSTEWVPFVINDESSLYPRYLYWFLQSDRFIAIARGNVRAATKSRERIKKERLFAVKMSLPPLPEQQRIAAILDKADALRAQRRTAVAKLDTLLQATFLDMFGDPVTNPMGWEFHYLSEYFSKDKEGTKCGPFGSALKKHEYVNDGVPVWVMDNIKDMQFKPEGSLFITEQKYQQLSPYSVSTGDIMISRAGTVGKMCVAETDGDPNSIISTNLIRLSLDADHIDPYYFVSLMTFFKGRVGRLKTGEDGAYSFMNTGILKKLKIPVPSIQLQREYRRVLHKIRAEEQQQETSLDELDNLFHSLQQRAFRGEL